MEDEYMAAEEGLEKGQVIQLRSAKAAKASEQKWGLAVMKMGFCIVPSLLLRAQRRLGLNPVQLAVLMQLCDYWWEEGRKPYPSKDALARRLGIGARQVQRHIAALEEAGLVQRVERIGRHGGKLTNAYDLSGLVRRLKELEPDFREVEEENRKRLKEVARPGLRRRKAVSQAE
jgi:DNA-binding transcriptional ArsR family regulator